MVVKITIKADRKHGSYQMNKTTKERIVRHLDQAISNLLTSYAITASRIVYR